MGRKSKYSKELKIEICKRYLNGEGSTYSLADEVGTTDDIVGEWIKKYEKYGDSAFDEKEFNNSYSKEFKEQVVKEYLNTGISLRDLARKYDIPANDTVRKWILKYTKGEENEDYRPQPEVYNMAAKKTTVDERIAIVKYCIEHDNNYAETAACFGCSYAQVYQWVKKYNEAGEDGLIDRRGKKKPEEELTDIEKANRQIKLLEQQLELEKRKNELLKKVLDL